MNASSGTNERNQEQQLGQWSTGGETSASGSGEQAGSGNPQRHGGYGDDTPQDARLASSDRSGGGQSAMGTSGGSSASEQGMQGSGASSGSGQQSGAMQASGSGDDQGGTRERQSEEANRLYNEHRNHTNQ